MPRNGVAEVINEMAEEAVEAQARRLEEKDERRKPRVDPKSPEAVIERAFSRVEPDKGYYAKVYQKYPLPPEYGGRPMFLTDILNPETVTDYESELLRLAKLYNWPDGMYEVRLLQRDVEGIKDRMDVVLHVPSIAPALVSNPTNGHSQPGLDPYKTLIDTAKFAKDLATMIQAPQNQGVTADAIAKTVESIVKARGDSQPALNIVDLFKAMKDMSPPAPTPTSLLETVKAIRELTPAVVSKEESMIDTLIKLKQAGLLGDDKPREDGMEKAITLLSTLIPLIQAMSGGGGDGKGASLGVEIVRALGPQVGTVVKDVTTTINHALASRGGRPLPAAPRVTVAPPVPASPEVLAAPATPPETFDEIQAPPPEPIPVEQEAVAMLPLFKPIKAAIEVRDHAFFPQLEEIILKYGASSYDDLLDGKLTLDQIVEWVKPLGGEFFGTPHARVYFAEFIEWAKAKRASEIVAKCPKCNEEYVFASEEALTAEPNCEACQDTPLERVGHDNILPPS